LKLEVTVVDDGVRTPGARGLGAWIARSAPASARGGVIVAVVSDARMRALNKRFRKVDRVTDVLSFPAGKGQPGHGPTSERRRPAPFLGEIAIARGVAARQARRAGHRPATELRILALHGVLHLLGYDHEVDEGQMARIEARLRRRAGLPVGLIARSS
jgi:probable rRNA maturation factor